MVYVHSEALYVRITWLYIYMICHIRCILYNFRKSIDNIQHIYIMNNIQYIMYNMLYAVCDKVICNIYCIRYFVIFYMLCIIFCILYWVVEHVIVSYNTIQDGML